MAKDDKRDVARAKAAASEKKLINKFVKNAAKSGVNVGGSGSVSARQPSVAVKTGVKNKIKAQGAKINSSATSGYNRRGKK